MNVDSFEFLKGLPQEQYTSYKGELIQIRDLIKLMHAERFEETLPKYLTRKRKKKK